MVAGFLSLSLLSAHGASEAVIHSFTGSPDGVGPQANMVAYGGALYGTTFYGGTAGYGTVFRLRPAGSAKTVWVETVLHSFVGGRDGRLPAGNVVADKHGNLWGASFYGGTYNCGTIFRLSPGTFNYTIVYNFRGGTDGCNVLGNLLVGADGGLYGVTVNDGKNGDGTVFKVAPVAGTSRFADHVLYDVGFAGHGGAPTGGLVADKNGALYGTEQDSFGGTVFKLSPPTRGTAWTATTLHTFGLNGDGYGPAAGVTITPLGILLGTTQLGGAKNQGTVFRLVPPPKASGSWTYSILYSFTDGKDGKWPYAGLIKDKVGALYGTAFEGGAGRNGAIFRLNPPSGSRKTWTETTLHNFGAKPDGGAPSSGLTVTADGLLYGNTVLGGSANAGAVYKLSGSGFVP